MIDLSNLEAWFVTGSQQLYGPETLKKVEEHATAIAGALAASSQIPVKIVPKPVMTSGDSIHQLCLDANSSKSCIGLITWMHTFSPARMWIAGLRSLDKPLLHLHTQFNEELPWSTIDMDFMNLNQSAHGDREFGFIGARMHLKRKVVVGFWQDTAVHAELGAWTRAACAWQDAQHLKVARLGDNMRNVAVTEGNKVNAAIKLGYSVNGYGVGDLVKRVQQATDKEVERLTAEYDETYTVAESLRPGEAGASRCRTRRELSWDCGLFWKRPVRTLSPIPSRTCMALSNSRASRCNDSWPRGMASVRRAIGKQLLSCGQ